MSEMNANICLTFNNETNTLLTRLAQENFSAVFEGYCLGIGVFPHVTLGQIHISSSEQKNVLKRQIGELKHSPYIEFEGTYANFNNKGFIWHGFSVLNSQNLSDLQAKIDEITSNMELKLFNPSLSDYWPHATLARTADTTPLPSFQVPQAFIGATFETKITLGSSDEKGQLLGLVV